MKRIIESEEGGLTAELGHKLVFFCGDYIYIGTLAGVNSDHVEITDAKLVYETGPLSDGEWSDAQSLPSPWRVMLAGVESWGPVKC